MVVFVYANQTYLFHVRDAELPRAMSEIGFKVLPEVV